MSVNGSSVAIAGGGIAGLTTALLLARAGASATLLERVTEPSAVGAGILLQPNGLAVLAGLGLDQALGRHGHHPVGTAIRSVAMATTRSGPPFDRQTAPASSRLRCRTTAAGSTARSGCAAAGCMSACLERRATIPASRSALAPP